MADEKLKRHTPMASLLDILAGFADRASIASERVKENLCPNCGKEKRLSDNIPVCMTCSHTAGVAGLDMLLKALQNTKK